MGGGADVTPARASDGGDLTLPVSPVPPKFPGEIRRLARPDEPLAHLAVHGRELLQGIAQSPPQGVPRVSVAGLKVSAFHLVHDRLHRFVHENE